MILLVKKIFLFSLVVFLTFSFFLLKEKVVSADNGTGIAISPLVFELSGKPGDSIENFVKVLNPSDTSSVSVLMEFELISPTGEEGQVFAENPEEEDILSIARWIEADPGEFTLDPGEERLVRFTVNVPQEAEPGGHYGAVLATVGAASGPEGTGVGVSYRVGSLVLLTVPGPMIEELVITDFFTENRSKTDLRSRAYFEYGPVPFEVRFENKGTVHVKPNTLITITNLLGAKVAEIPIEERNILPNSTRKLSAEWRQERLWGGRYTATLSGTYGRTNSQLSSEVLVFWAFPWKVGLAILIVLILLILLRKRLVAAFKVFMHGEGKRSSDNSEDSSQKSGNKDSLSN